MAERGDTKCKYFKFPCFSEFKKFQMPSFNSVIKSKAILCGV